MIGPTPIIRLEGFEAALVEFIGDNFRFSDLSIRDIALEGGRHFFVGTLPSAEAIAVTVAEIVKLDSSVFKYDPKKEPAILIDKQPSTGVVPSSSLGGRHIWLEQFVLRLGKVPELATVLLEELYEFMLESVHGSVFGGFQVKGAEPVQRPATLTVEQDDSAYISAIIRFRGVPFPG